MIPIIADTWHTLVGWDQGLFHLINSWRHPWADECMHLISEKLFWVWAYIVLCWVLYRRYAWPGIGWLLAGVALAVLISDQLASGLLKPLIGRLRPCQPDAGLPFTVFTYHGYCGGRFGFVSSHAANFFALARYVSGWLPGRRWAVALFGTAALVAYSRIYLGVHYPGDVLGGALVGLMAGWLAWRLVRLRVTPLSEALTSG
ncbi:MAG: phosphatase PAP2 family protein [Bacteroidia bacterium]|nr:phosphatase PAP2 family protein [Bacteroidia bacterium]